MKRNSAIKYSIVGVVVLGMIGAGYYRWKSSQKNPFEKYLTVKAERGAIRRTVSSTGTLQAVVTVQVGSQVSGRILELHADFNSVVKKGQILAIIDPANFEAQKERSQAQLATAEAEVKNAEANLVNRRAELSSTKANLEASRVAMRESERQYDRARGLFKDGLISERDLETAQSTYDQNKARTLQAGAQVNQTEATIKSALSQQDQAAAYVKQAKAELQMAEVNLRYTSIISPIDGVVIERNVDIGQTVAASFQAPILYLIANDLAKMQLIAQIDEADIGALSEKAKVDFAVDAFPGQAFRGQIEEIRLSSKLPGASSSGSTSSTGGTGTGGTASNVVVYNVMIDVDNPQLKLRPGMTANVNFTVASAQNVLKIANAALRFKPSDKKPEEIQRLLASLEVSASADTKQADSTAQQYSGREAPAAADRSGSPTDRGAGERRFNRKAGLSSAGSAQAIIGPSTHEMYGINAGMKIRFPQAEEPKPVPGVVWVLDQVGQPQPRKVMLGITNGRETAVVQGDLKEGDTVITGDLGDEETAAQQRAAPRSPFGGATGPGGRRLGR
jgi:HlyD family secretion protein